ncbi:phosphotransferase family protein [Pseudonocardia halophobica]|uniref:Aminoglycoside phosphotransferase n=1 Tax=Pseudonocardia halophobica TaxID=29401 RepID=A0A9W6NVI4_9PSEU|nr:phosphotransferase family protein [Pseudonocardia halophobica]GLL10571.1 aminoglycoside phosphotransferase [Pseudonocardia halophobica]
MSDKQPTPRRDLDPEELRARLTSLLQWPVEVLDLAVLEGGRSSVTYRATLRRDDETDQDVVVKLAPPGLPPTANRDVLRQARILAALDRDGIVPVPTVLLTDAGAPPEVPPLFLMDLVAGSSVEPIFGTSGELPAPEVVRARALAAATTLAGLHAVDPATVAVGETVVSPADELARWERTLTAAGGSDAASKVLTALQDSLPVSVAPTLVHGDFRLGNCLFVGEILTSVLDWEIWALGDPRVDLAWLLLTAMPEVHPGADREPVGMPSAAELTARYEERSTRPDATAELSWFLAAALYKMAAMSRHIGKRFAPDDPRRTGREASAERMLATSLELL